MNRYWITYTLETGRKQESVFANDATSAIHAFLKKNPDIDRERIVWVESKSFQACESGIVTDNQSSRDEQGTSLGGPPKSQTVESNITESRDNPANSVWTNTQSKKRDSKIVELVTGGFIASMLVGFIWIANVFYPTNVAKESTPTASTEKKESSGNAINDELRLTGNIVCVTSAVINFENGRSKKIVDGDVVRFHLYGSTATVFYPTGKIDELVLEKSVDGEEALANTYSVKGGDTINTRITISASHSGDEIVFLVRYGEGELDFGSTGLCRVG